MRIFIDLAVWLYIFANVTHAAELGSKVPTEAKDASLRNKKLFSLFTIVNFPNQGCASQDTRARNGTCYTSTECRNKGGMKSGNCAAGFGVCCLFIVSSATNTISENCTYIQNPSYPSIYAQTAALTYTINKCSSDVCTVRLDMETFSNLGPANTEEENGGECQDSFQVEGSSGISSPVICGLNTGQHLYVEMGNSGSSDTATLAFNFAAATSTTRTWEIKATQIPCGSSANPPEGCLQWHTTLAGRFETFNFADTTNGGQHLATQNYGICIRQEEGYCCIQYQKCADADSFSISNTAADFKASQDTLCSKDYVEIDGASASCGMLSQISLFCGGTGTLSTQFEALKSIPIYDTAPFVVTIHTDNTISAIPGKVSRGVCLDYKQIPC